MSRFRRIFVPVMGFTQSTRTSTGMEALWCGLRELSSQHTLIVTPEAWDADAEARAALVDRHAEPDAAIYVFPYSWGCGQYFIDFAKALDARGRRIRHAVLCDGVYRSRTLPKFLPANVLSMLSFPTLKIPQNVDEVTWFYQRRNRPAGHKPVAEGKRTVINPGIRLSLRHEQMDDSTDFHDAVMRIAGML